MTLNSMKINAWVVIAYFTVVEHFNVWNHPARDSITTLLYTLYTVDNVYAFDLKVEWSTLYCASYGTKINLNWFRCCIEWNKDSPCWVKSKFDEKQEQRARNNSKNWRNSTQKKKLKSYLHMEHRHDRAVQKIPFAIGQFELLSA